MLQIRLWNYSSSKIECPFKRHGDDGVGEIGCTMRDAGLEEAIKAAGGIASLARAIGIAQPSVSAWSRIPPERVLAVEALTRVHRFILRPDLYGSSGGQVSSKSASSKSVSAKSASSKVPSSSVERRPSSWAVRWISNQRRASALCSQIWLRTSG